MVFYDNPFILNRFYVAGYVHFALVSTSTCLISMHFSAKMLALLKPTREMTNDKRLNSLIYLIENFRRSVVYGLPTGLVSLLLPIWIGVTPTTAAHGQPYFFYYEFFYNTLVRAVVVGCALVVLQKTISSEVEISTTSDQKDANEDRKSGFSYDIEELQKSKE